MGKTILGVSLGTRNIGIAVMRDAELIDYRVKCFRERWTNEKRNTILTFIERLVEYHQVFALALKSSDPVHSSRQLDQLVKGIVRVFERKRVTVHSYAIVTVKLGLGVKDAHKDELIAQIAEHYPELRKIYLKEINKRHRYYDKMFEAIAIAKWSTYEHELSYS